MKLISILATVQLSISGCGIEETQASDVASAGNTCLLKLSDYEMCAARNNRGMLNFRQQCADLGVDRHVTCGTEQAEFALAKQTAGEFARGKVIEAWEIYNSLLINSKETRQYGDNTIRYSGHTGEGTTGIIFCVNTSGQISERSVVLEADVIPSCPTGSVHYAAPWLENEEASYHPLLTEARLRKKPPRTAIGTGRTRTRNSE